MSTQVDNIHTMLYFTISLHICLDVAVKKWSK
nr:MAG TPA: hypothetical protein [Caudoviricetes sp.]